jgi:hypothetical protein
MTELKEAYIGIDVATRAFETWAEISGAAAMA